MFRIINCLRPLVQVGLMILIVSFASARASAQELRIVDLQWIDHQAQPAAPYVQARNEIIGAPNQDTTVPPYTTTIDRTIDYGDPYGIVDVFDSLVTAVEVGTSPNNIYWNGEFFIDETQTSYPIQAQGSIETRFTLVPPGGGLYQSSGALKLTFKVFPSGTKTGDALAVSISTTMAISRSTTASAEARLTLTRPDSIVESTVVTGPTQSVPYTKSMEVGVGQTFSLILSAKAMAINQFAAASARFENFLIEATPIEPEATFITLTVHGQIKDAFFSSSWQTQPWVHDVPASIAAKIDQINQERANAQPDPLDPISFVGLEGDWGLATGIGVKPLLISRMTYLLSNFLSEPLRTIGFVTAAATETAAREKTSDASRQSAARIAQDLKSAIQSVRQQYGDKHPIFVDIVCHSRGTTVTGRVLELLAASSQGAGPLEVNVIYLDIIDSHLSEPDLVRPFALSGHLLGDPIVQRHANEIISHFHADCTAICNTQNCDSTDVEEDSIFGAGVLCRLEQIGYVFGDELLRSIGMPKGHARSSYLTNISEIECFGSTHLSIEADFTNAIIALAVGDPPTASCPLSFALTSQIGRMIAIPTTSIPNPVPFLSGRNRVVVEQQRTGSLIIDSSFDDSAQVVANAASLLDSPEMQQFLTPEFHQLRTYLESTVADEFPTELTWIKESGMPSIEMDGSNDAYVRFQGASGISQQLAFDSTEIDDFVVDVQFEFTDPTGNLLVSLSGDGLLWEFPATTSKFLPHVRHTITANVHRAKMDALNYDSVAVSGSSVRVYSIDVKPAPFCAADIAGSAGGEPDGQVNVFDLFVLLSNWNMNGPGADLAPANNIVDVFDLFVMLSAWGDCP